MEWMKEFVFEEKNMCGVFYDNVIDVCECFVDDLFWDIKVFMKYL